jgi:hypothetical protein
MSKIQIAILKSTIVTAIREMQYVKCKISTVKTMNIFAHEQ